MINMAIILLSKLYNFRLAYGLGRVTPFQKMGKVCWTPPEEGRVKINFDGAGRGNSRVSGCGCVTRDYKGNTLTFMEKWVFLIKEFES
jgi:hypothetical protein